MNRYSLLILFLLISASMQSQQVPEGYINVYRQDYSSNTAMKDFRFSFPGTWEISRHKENRFLECQGLPAGSIIHTSPQLMCIIYSQILGEFILEADLMSTGPDQENRDFHILYSIKDPSRFYDIHLSSRLNDSAHGIFLVKNGLRSRVSDWQTDGVSWGNEKWHKVRVTRNIVNRSVAVFFDNMHNPVMTSHDPELVMGYLGFGSSGHQGRIDNIRVWAPTSIPEPAHFFECK